jgi:lactate dehydrogenase-like 2-hydroxyacid dehydrogenase
MKAVFARRPGRAIRGPDDRTLDEVLVSSDVISMHLPASASTRRDTGKRSPTMALFVNTASGSVDEDALVWALSTARSRALRSTYEKEPAIPGSPRSRTSCRRIRQRESRNAHRDGRAAVRNVLAVPLAARCSRRFPDARPRPFPS